MKQFVLAAWEEHVQTINKSLEIYADELPKIAQVMANTIRSGGTIYWCGNGGSAAESQHMAAELVGQFSAQRKGLSSISFTTDTSVLTAVPNDFNFEEIFSRQVEAHVEEKDFLIGISTSGNSKNVINAMLKARDINAKILNLTGRDGGASLGIADFEIVVKSDDTPRIQECHTLINHILCLLVEKNLGY
jgi:D-sedoheptulose 7-phosphate isomerase